MLFWAVPEPFGTGGGEEMISISRESDSRTGSPPSLEFEGRILRFRRFAGGAILLEASADVTTSVGSPEPFGTTFERTPAVPGQSEENRATRLIADENLTCTALIALVRLTRMGPKPAMFGVKMYLPGTRLSLLNGLHKYYGFGFI